MGRWRVPIHHILLYLLFSLKLFLILYSHPTNIWHFLLNNWTSAQEDTKTQAWRVPFTFYQNDDLILVAFEKFRDWNFKFIIIIIFWLPNLPPCKSLINTLLKNKNKLFHNYQDSLAKSMYLPNMFLLCGSKEQGPFKWS